MDDCRCSLCWSRMKSASSSQVFLRKSISSPIKLSKRGKAYAHCLPVSIYLLLFGLLYLLRNHPTLAWMQIPNAQAASPASNLAGSSSQVASSSGTQNAISQTSNLIKAQVANLLTLKQQLTAKDNINNNNNFAHLSSREIEKQIVDKILGEGYDKRIRPAGSGPYNASQTGNDGPTIVKVNTLIRSISKIDDVTMEYSVQLSLRQEWTDDRLAFEKMPQYKHYGLNSITLTEQERLWKPDLFFRNEKEGHFHKIIMPNVLLRINGEGQVLYSIRISLVLACPMDLKYYPLDKQKCTIEMASYGYLDEDLKFIWKKDSPVQINEPLNLPRFALGTYNTSYCTSRTTTGAYSCLRIDLIFKREFSYYLIQIYIPCCMLVIVSWVSFWLDPNAIPARVSLGVTTLLTMATQISGINASLPPVSYIKAIDVWTGVCLTFVFGALLEFALVNYASRSDQHKREMLNSALTHTQQMRWREATAAAAAAGVAPPTSPPTDENSPSMLASKHQAFFGPYKGVLDPTIQRQQQHHCLYPQIHRLPNHTASSDQPMKSALTLNGSTPGPPCSAAGFVSRAGISTVDGNGAYNINGVAAKVEHLNNGTSTNSNTANIMLNNSTALANNCNANKNAPQINCALQYLYMISIVLRYITIEAVMMAIVWMCSKKYKYFFIYRKQNRVQSVRVVGLDR